MMNQSNTTPLDRGQPYEEMGPIDLDPVSIDRAPDLDLQGILQAILINTGTHRVMDGALLLYERICCDPTYDGLSRTDIFAACLDTAMIWEFG